MTGTFKANNPYNNFLLFGYGLILKLPTFIHPVVPHFQKADGILYNTVLGWLSSYGDNFPQIYSIIAFLLLYLQAISFNKLVNDQRLLPKANYLTGMSYLLITSLFREWYILSAPLIINTLLVWILTNLSNLYNNPHAKTLLLNIGMLTGMATLFYFPSIAFALLIITGLSITRAFNLQEWVIAFIGILVPYYFLGAFLFVTDRWQQFRFPDIALALPRFHKSAWAYIAIILILFTIVVGISFVQNNMTRLLLQSRKSWNLIYLCLLVTLFIPFLNTVHVFDYWILTAIPVSAFAASAFLFPERKWFALAVHWGLVLLTVITGYFVR